jgi:hypothetical protein
MSAEAHLGRAPHTTLLCDSSDFRSASLLSCSSLHSLARRIASPMSSAGMGLPSALGAAGPLKFGQNVATRVRSFPDFGKVGWSLNSLVRKELA